MTPEHLPWLGLGMAIFCVIRVISVELRKAARDRLALHGAPPARRKEIVEAMAKLASAERPAMRWMRQSKDPVVDRPDDGGG
jgi:hypothetical protein